MSAAGGIAIRLSRGGAEIVNRRATLPHKFLVGRPAAEVVDLLPRLFAVCAYAQGSAAAAACEAALGVSIAPSTDAHRRFLTGAEAAREHLQRLILGAAEILGEKPEPGTLAALRQLMQATRNCAGRDGGGGGGGGRSESAAGSAVSALNRLIIGTLYCDVAEADPTHAADGFLAWADGGRSAPARLCRFVAERARGPVPRSEIVALPDLDPSALAERLLGEAGGDFAALPTWDGCTCETTAFTRQRAVPLIRGLEERFGDGILTRLAARQVEIVTLAVQLATAAAAADTAADGAEMSRLAAREPADGVGVSQVETARGRLIHAVRLRAGRVAAYRILAPTEWNFHPQGPAAARLSRLTRAEESGPDGDLESRARLLIEAFDPCVPYTLAVQ